MLIEHVGSHVVLSPEGAVVVASAGTESSYLPPPPIVERLNWNFAFVFENIAEANVLRKDDDPFLKRVEMYRIATKDW